MFAPRLCEASRRRHVRGALDASALSSSRHIEGGGVMMRRALDEPIPPDAKDVAVNRLRFLTAEPLARSADPTGTNQVRAPILASWRRSRELKVAADKVELPYLRDPDIDTPLTRSAEPVLRRLHEQLAGQPVSIVLTDAAGLVLIRRTADPGLERHLDGVLLAP